MIKITLGDTLNDLGITRNKLAVESKIRPATINSLVKGDAALIKFDTLCTMLDTINDIAIEKGKGKQYTIKDIIDYQYTFTKES